MSLDFAADKRILATELFDGRLDRYGIHQGCSSDGIRYLADRIGVLWVFLHDDKFVDFFTVSISDGDPSKILVAIQDAFKTKIFSERKPQYWGFDTVEEWENSTE